MNSSRVSNRLPTERKRHALACVVAATLACLLSVAAFYPGVLSRDSLVQLMEARAGIFSDWHPPVMAALWRLLNLAWPGPQGMLLFQALLFWIGLGTLVALATTGVLAPILWCAGIALLPPVLGLIGTIWKDVGMGAALLLGVAALRVAERRAGPQTTRAIPWLTAALAFSYAAAVRHNAPVALLPLCLWAGAIAVRRPGACRRLGAGVGFFVAVTAAGSLANALLTSTPTYPVQQIFLHDLAAISLDQRDLGLLPPPPVRPAEPFSLSDLAELYSPQEVVPLYCCNPHVRRFPMLTDRESVETLQRRWFEIVPEHIGSYLKHRFRVYQQLLGLRRATVCLPYQDATEYNSLGLGSPRSKLHSATMAYLEIFRNSVLFRGWFYLALNSLLLGTLLLRLAVVRRLPKPSEWAALAVISSGFSYLAVSFFVAATCDFRMLWWSVLAVAIFPLMLDPVRTKNLAFRIFCRIRYALFPNPASLVVSETQGHGVAGNRLCIFAHYDPRNQISDAVVFYLGKLHELGLEIQLVSTSESLSTVEIAKALPFCSKVLVRKNVGIDFGSWKVALAGDAHLDRLETLILANDSVFGPLQALAPVFAQMNARDLDLWGMSESHEGGFSHLQSYFLVFGARALRSPAFRAFWGGFRFYLRKRTYIEKYEIGLSRLAQREAWQVGALATWRGVREAALRDPALNRVLRSRIASGENLNPTLFLWDILLREFGFPFLKAELPRLNRLELASFGKSGAWRGVVARYSTYDLGLIDRAL